MNQINYSKLTIEQMCPCEQWIVNDRPFAVIIHRCRTTVRAAARKNAKTAVAIRSRLCAHKSVLAVWLWYTLWWAPWVSYPSKQMRISQTTITSTRWPVYEVAARTSCGKRPKSTTYWTRRHGKSAWIRSLKRIRITWQKWFASVMTAEHRRRCGHFRPRWCTVCRCSRWLGLVIWCRAQNGAKASPLSTLRSAYRCIFCILWTLAKCWRKRSVGCIRGFMSVAAIRISSTMAAVCIHERKSLYQRRPVCG